MGVKGRFKVQQEKTPLFVLVNNKPGCLVCLSGVLAYWHQAQWVSSLPDRAVQIGQGVFWNYITWSLGSSQVQRPCHDLWQGEGKAGRVVNGWCGGEHRV